MTNARAVAAPLEAHAALRVAMPHLVDRSLQQGHLGRVTLERQT
jgi:hypothetical protein